MTCKRFIIALSLVVVALGAFLVYVLVQMHNDNTAASKPMVTSQVQAEKITTIAPPALVPSAEVVAYRLHCKKFTNIEVSGGIQGIVLDEGSCYIGHTKYAIDTFQTPASRNLWLKMAEPYGVVPKFETAHSVTYKSVTS